MLQTQASVQTQHYVNVMFNAIKQNQPRKWFPSQLQRKIYTIQIHRDFPFTPIVLSLNFNAGKPKWEIHQFKNPRYLHDHRTPTMNLTADWYIENVLASKLAMINYDLMRLLDIPVFIFHNDFREHEYFVYQTNHLGLTKISHDNTLQCVYRRHLIDVFALTTVLTKQCAPQLNLVQYYSRVNQYAMQHPSKELTRLLTPL